MATAQSEESTNHAYQGWRHRLLAGSSDEELLDRFVDGDEESSESAFRAIVGRHGPMVMGVCRHALHHEHDAEDAFQATFLTLSRKADTIRDRRVLSSWLYEVAYRIAIRARAGASRRRDQEVQAAVACADGMIPEQERTVALNDLQPALHEEVNRLPEKYRLPIILTYLQGKSNEEVAELLEWPVGTVKGRLFRARNLLRSRLTRRGLVLSASLLCMALGEREGEAGVVSDALIESTVRLALRSVRGICKRLGYSGNHLANRSRRIDARGECRTACRGGSRQAQMETRVPLFCDGTACSGIWLLFLCLYKSLPDGLAEETLHLVGLLAIRKRVLEHVRCDVRLIAFKYSYGHHDWLVLCLPQSSCLRRRVRSAA